MVVVGRNETRIFNGFYGNFRVKDINIYLKNPHNPLIVKSTNLLCIQPRKYILCKENDNVIHFIHLFLNKKHKKPNVKQRRH